MKIAICLFGYTGSYGNRENIKSDFHPSTSFNINNNIFYKRYDIDFFIHSWSKNFQNDLISLYNPKKIKCEKQPSFSEIKLNDYKLDQIKTYKSLIIKHGNNINSHLKNLIIASNSRWTSNYKALKLMQNYATKNNCSYDLVIQMRLDLIFYKKLILKKLDKNIFYHLYRDTEKDIAINDLFFISNYKNAKKFSKIVNNLTRLSIRPVCASKQFLDILKIKTKGVLTLGEDVILLRNHLSKKNILIYKRNILYRTLKKFIKVF
jgi:hypothetical protein